MPFTLAIAQTCRIGALYGYSPSAPENNVFCDLLFLLDLVRLTIQCELANGIVYPDQQKQRLSLEFLIHLVGTGVVPIHDGAHEELNYRIDKHIRLLSQRLRAVGHRVQYFGDDLAYLRAVWTEETNFTEGKVHCLFSNEVAVRPDDKNFTPHNIARAYAPLVGVDVDELVDECPDSMENLLLQYFELAKRSGVVAALANMASIAAMGKCE
ncbi:hypothetical protein Sste5346_006055 [Sporothrix stenoceras]|uniref:Uncharacterized protein n=1 Tax=Sporothrix stenoceras TaxID=5173 RepID=A0ABR3YZV5_9PEZI